MPVAQRQVHRRELLVQVITQRAGRDLLRIEIVVVGAARAAPIAVAATARIIGEIGRIGCVVVRAPRLRRVAVGRVLGRAIAGFRRAVRSGERTSSARATSSSASARSSSGFSWSIRSTS